MCIFFCFVVNGCGTRDISKKQREGKEEETRKGQIEQTEEKKSANRENGRNNANTDVVTIPVIFRVDPKTGEKRNEKIVEQFNEAYKGQYYVDVEWRSETEEEYRVKLKQLNAEDKLPAIIFDVKILPSFYKKMVDEGRLMDLTSFIENDVKLKEAIDPQILEKCRGSDGKIYICPEGGKSLYGTGFFWNKQLFQQAGIEKFPDTWEEFWFVCDKLKEYGITPLSLHTEGTAWSPMLIATANAASTKEGSDFMKELFPTSYQNKTGIRIAKTLKRLFEYTTKDALYNDFDVAYKNFVQEKTAILANGYWQIEQFDDQFCDKVSFSSFPENTMVFSAGEFAWSIVDTYSEEVKEGAMEFLKFRVLEEEKKREKFLKETIMRDDLRGDYARAIEKNPNIIPNYQVEWNSILQEEVLEEALPRLVSGEITPEQFVQKEDASIKAYNMEQ